jgi:flagellar biosynthesis protein FlhF
MVVKTYSAPSIQAAMNQIKQEIGEDAMIISTRRIPKAPRDPYGRDMFQIEASAPERSSALAEPVMRRKAGKDDDVVRMSRRLVADDPVSSAKKGAANDWIGTRDELGDIRDMLWVTGMNDDFLELVQSEKDAFRVYSRLLLSGISEKRVKMLIKKGAETHGEEDYASRVLKVVMASVETENPFQHSGDGERVVAAYIGPTGVGKTTTIAKLAAYLGLKRKKKVGLISVDSYRIGAVDQLKTYSSIIGIPCIPAFTGEDLKKALNKLSGMDYVLIDTAGQSHLDGSRMGELNAILNHGGEITTHLVISASMGRLDMKEAVERFELLSPASYVFTKVDETRHTGRIVDQMMERKKPVSFITNGQEVPEDLIVANRKQILQLLIDPDSFRKKEYSTSTNSGE